MTFGQRSTQKVKINWFRVKVNRYMVLVGSGLVTDQAVKLLTHPDDMALTWTRADVNVLLCLLTWNDDVIW